MFLLNFSGTTMLVSDESSLNVPQDAHEFLNFLLNDLVDILEKETAKGPAESLSPPQKVYNGLHGDQVNGVKKEPLVTWVHKNFQVSMNIDLKPNSTHLWWRWPKWWGGQFG